MDNHKANDQTKRKLIIGGAAIVATIASYLVSKTSAPRDMNHDNSLNFDGKLSIFEHPDLYPYMVQMSVNPTQSQQELWKEIRNHPKSMMTSSPDSANYLAWLVRTMGFKKVIEVGVFLGYTTLTLANSLPEDGKVVALDVSEEFTSVGEKYWKQAGVREKIDLRIAPAVETLDQMLLEEGEGSYDFAFIDADKRNYENYYEKCLQLVRVGGVVAVDNVFWHGKILKPEDTWDEDTKVIGSLNKKIQCDHRVHITMLPFSDGITLCTKLRSISRL